MCPADGTAAVALILNLAGQSSGFPATGSSIAKVSIPIRIENRDKKFTSHKAAVSFVQRGIAKWSDESRTAIRFLEPEEQFQARLARQEERYWRAVAAQRGGEDVAFEWKPSISNGYLVMGAVPVPVQKRPQLAHVGVAK
ncbi:MAG: hypothetical protein HYX72_14510 [Acidobacteria bacterium]|nr:hypothetical protein [Acidobacteriota bacterium]